MAHIGRMPRSQLSLPKSELSRELRAPRTSVHEAFADLSAGEALELLDRAPDPDRAARLPGITVVGALGRAGRRDVDGKATTIQQTLKADQLRQPRPVQNAYAAIVSSQTQLINILNIEIAELGQVADACAAMDERWAIKALLRP
jgi:hypothetical protein